MDSVDAIFEAFGGPTAVARAVGMPPSAASEMRRRRSIPVRYWRRLVKARLNAGKHDLTYEQLVEMHTPSVVPDADEHPEKVQP